MGEGEIKSIGCLFTTLYWIHPPSRINARRVGSRENDQVGALAIFDPAQDDVAGVVADRDFVAAWLLEGRDQLLEDSAHAGGADHLARGNAGSVNLAPLPAPATALTHR